MMGMMSRRRKNVTDKKNTSNKPSTTTASSSGKHKTSGLMQGLNVPGGVDTATTGQEEHLLHLIQMYERAGGSMIRPEEDFAAMLQEQEDYEGEEDFEDDDDDDYSDDEEDDEAEERGEGESVGEGQEEVENREGALGEGEREREQQRRKGRAFEDLDDKSLLDGSEIDNSGKKQKKTQQKSNPKPKAATSEKDELKAKGLLSKHEIEIYTKAQQCIVSQDYLQAMRHYETLITESHPDIPIVLEYARLCEITEHEHMAIDLYEGILSFQPLHRRTLKLYCELLCELSLSFEDKKYVQRALDLLTPIVSMSLSGSSSSAIGSSSSSSRSQLRQERLFRQVRHDFDQALRVKQGLDVLEQEALKERQERMLMSSLNKGNGGKSKQGKGKANAKRKLGPISAEWANTPSTATTISSSSSKREQRSSGTSTVGIDECPVCSKPASFSCSRCKSISYCGRDCQVKHWKEGHKNVCVPVTVAAATASTTTTASTGLHNRKGRKAAVKSTEKENMNPAAALVHDNNVHISADSKGDVAGSIFENMDIAKELGENKDNDESSNNATNSSSSKFSSSNKLAHASIVEVVLYYAMIVGMASLFVYLMMNSPK